MNMLKENWEDSIYISSNKTTDRSELSTDDLANGCTASRLLTGSGQSATISGLDYPNIEFKIYDW